MRQRQFLQMLFILLTGSAFPAFGNDDINSKVNAEPRASVQLNGKNLVDRTQEIKRLDAEIAKNVSPYEKFPRRKFLGARTDELAYARYDEEFSAKIEHIANMNYPQEASRRKIYGSVRLTVSIFPDGSVEKVEIEKSSGQRLLDDAAVRIVKLAAPFAPFPPEFRKKVDILSITRAYTFTNSDMLKSK